MNRYDATIVGYSLLLLIGGVTGYAVAGSIASLLTSTISAILLIGALFLIRFYPIQAYHSINLLLAALTLFFAYRWYNSKFFPPGFLCLVTAGVLITALLLRRNK